MLHRLAIATHGPNNCCLTGAQQGYKGGETSSHLYQPLSPLVRNFALSFFTAALTSQTGSRRGHHLATSSLQRPGGDTRIPYDVVRNSPGGLFMLLPLFLPCSARLSRTTLPGTNRDGHCFASLPASIKSIG